MDKIRNLCPFGKRSDYYLACFADLTANGYTAR
jgi:hypothetical protein